MRLPQGRRSLRLDRDHAHVRSFRLEGGRHPRDQPAAPDRDEHRGHLGALVENLERGGALSGGRARVLEGVDEHRARLALECAGGLDGVVVRLARLANLDGEAAELLHLRSRGGAGHEEGGAHRPPEPRRGERHAERVVPGRGGHHPAAALVLVERREEVQGAPDLEGAGRLPALELQPQVVPRRRQALAQRCRPEVAGDRGPRPLDLGERQAAHVARSGPAATRSRRGSPQWAAIASATRARRRTRAAMSAPSGAIGSPTQRETRPGRGRPQSPRRTWRVPRSARGTTGAPAAGRRHEGAQAEGAEAGRGDEGALGEEEDVLAVAEGPRHEVGVGDTLQRVPAIDGEVAAAPGEGADQRVAEHLALGDEQEVGGEQGQDRGHVGVGRVVRGEHQRAATGQALQALGLEAAADDPEAGAGGEARQREGEAPARHHGHEEPGGEEQERQGEGEPRAVEEAPGPSRPGPRGLRRRHGREGGLLGERRARGAAEGASQVPLLRGGAPDLAARGLRHRARGHEDDLVRRHVHQLGHALRDGRGQPVPFRSARDAGLGHHDQPLGAERRVLGAEGHHAASPDPLDARGGLLDLLRHEVAAALDDEVLPPAADVDLAGGAVGQVPGVEPPAGQRDGRGRLRLPVVAARHRGPAEDEAAHHALGHVRPGVVHDADLVLRELAPGRDELEGGRVARESGVRASLPLEGRARHAVDSRPAADRGEGERHRALGEAVDRHHRLGAESVGGEAAGEAVDRARAHGLRAVQGHPPGGEVEALERLVADAAGAQLVGEVGRGGERGAALVDRPEPALGPGEERGRGEEGEGQAVVEAGEPGADEPHVVVERQPAHSHVGRLHLEAPGDRADVGEEVVVGEEDALRLAGAARGVLDEGRVAGVALGSGDRDARGRELVGGHDGGEGRHAPASAGSPRAGRAGS